MPNRWGTVLTAGLVFVVVALTWLVNSDYNFNRWDNFEVFTPTALYLNKLWLSGHVPVINIHQNLGEAVLGNAQSAGFYFPYTLGILLLQAVGTSPQYLLDLMAVFHIPLAAAGWFCFLLGWGVRRELAFVGAMALVSTGFYLLGTSIWQHIGAEYAFFPWILFWLKRLLEDASPMRATLWIGLNWLLLSASSHAQQLIYISLNVVLYAAILLTVRGEWRKHWRRLLVPALWFVAFALPSFSYSLAIRSDSVRAGALPKEIFFEGAMTWPFLLGFLTPFFEVKPEAALFSTKLTYFSFLGVWVAVGWWCLWRLKTFRKEYLALLIPGLLFLDFSLGEYGLIYPLTRGLPVWGSFRWPFKFAYHFIVMLGALALIGLSQRDKAKDFFSRYGVWILLLMSLALGRPVHWTGWVFLLAQGIIAAGLSFGAGGRNGEAAAGGGNGDAAAGGGVARFRPLMLLAGSTLSFAMALTICFQQPAHRYTEKYGEFGSQYFGLERPMKYRLATMVNRPCVDSVCAMQSFATFSSATANDYLALSGHVMGLTPGWISEFISTNAYGLVNPAYVSEMVASPVFRSLGVRYYLVNVANRDDFQSTFGELGFVPKTKRDQWILFEDTRAPEAVSLPAKIEPEPRRIIPPVVYRREPYNSYWLQGIRQSKDMGEAQIVSWNWVPGRGVEAEVENKSGSEVLLHASLYAYSFMKGYIDGNPAEILRSNLFGSGLMVPPGRHKVAILASLGPFVYGLAAALIGALLGLAWLLYLKRTEPCAE